MSRKDKRMKIRILTLAIIVLTLTFVLVHPVAAGTGFDQYGYNDTARIFNGTGESWCMAGEHTQAWCDSFLGSSIYDKLIMKWNAAWDACNLAEGNDGEACLGAWTSNEWNGNVPGGSGVTDHYKIIWVGPEAEASLYWVAGGYTVWGSYEVIMDQGTGITGHV